MALSNRTAAEAATPPSAVGAGGTSRSCPAPRRDRLRPFAVICGAAIVGIGCFLEQSPALRLVLVLAGAVVLTWPQATLPGRRSSWSTASWGLSSSQRTGLLCALALLSLVITTAGDASWYFGSSKVRVWNVYHYAIGAKYFKELGYTDLYRASLHADAEGRNYWDGADKVRSLETYEVIRREESPLYDPSAAFSRKRYEQFERDLEALSSHRSPNGWRNIFRDRGYNATPFWTVVGRALTAVFPLDRPLTLKALSALDLVLLGATFWLVYRSFGAERLALFVLLLTASPVNDSRLLGGFLQYDWLCAGVAAFCLYQRRRPGWAGVLFAYAVLTRAFPVIFLVIAALPVLAEAARRRRLPRRPVRFAVALALACAVGMGVSLLNGRGLAGWTEWKEAIDLHRETHLIGDRRIGLEHFFTEDVGHLREDRSDAARLESASEQRGTYAAAAGLLVLGTLAISYRARLGDAWILGQIPVFALLVLSRYYHSFLATLGFLGRGRHAPLETRAIVALQLLVFGGFSAVELGGAEHYSSYVAINGFLAVFFVLTLVLASRLAPAAKSAIERSPARRGQKKPDATEKSPIEAAPRAP